ncbi:SRA stem-loop-interacting RNA-binding protein, mitochondrial-like [Galleria mellonella]|uniref:SRA stem-loop-interacting RNA-binding protein, mitochondrial-like n=1 Tax=Galleria mellonella TaxID=7137 RepID=A0A6J1WTN3_GALME|nr:SRA stem-loop-interacting RNA-binding protein, mitochondrial-like [Galleria mellonella]
MASTARAARLYVGNLPWTVGHRQLREYFAQFGAIQSSRVVFDRSTGLSKGYGFIEFVSPSAAADAINKQVHTLEGLNLTVQAQNN